MQLELPTLKYFQAQNLYSGSAGDFSFKVIPRDGTFFVYSWTGRLCMDKAENVREDQFPLDEAGYTAMAGFLREKAC